MTDTTTDLEQLADRVAAILADRAVVGPQSGELTNNWITDVVYATTIKSVWGNAIRDRVVHQYANKAQRDGPDVHPVEGMLCVTVDTDIVYQRVGSAWWVVAMPWRSFTPQGWAMPVAGTIQTVPVLTTIVSRWRQEFGTAYVHAEYVVSLGSMPFPGANSYVFGWSPIAAVGVRAMGAGKLFVNNNGFNYGGFARWYDDTGGGSRVAFDNVGPGVTAAAVVNVPSGNANITVSFDLVYECSPTVDA